MDVLFFLLLVASVVCLIIGLIKPKILKLNSRKKVALIFGISIIVLFILIGVTTPTNGNNTQQSSSKTNINNSVPKITDAKYLDSVQTDVIPNLEAAQKDMSDPTSAIWGGQYLEGLVASNESKAQGELSKAQINFQHLYGVAPLDLSQANDLLNQAISNQLSGVNALVSAINTAVPKGGFSYLDPDAAESGVTSIQQGLTNESQALSLIQVSTSSISQISVIKKEEQALSQISFQGAEGILQAQQTLKHNVQNNISQLGGGIQASYQDLRIEPADSNRPAGTTMITVFVHVGNILDKSSLFDVTNKLSSQLFQTVFSSGSTAYSGTDAYDVLVDYTGQTTDAYGNQKDDTPLLVYGLDKDTYQKINWSNFDQTTLCDFLKQQGTYEGGTGNDACNTLVQIQ